MPRHNTLRRPANPRFSSGPTTKRPGWEASVLADAALGRSHRSAAGREKLRHCITLMREILALPDDYHLGITPGSASGAMEMALWSLLGARGVDVFAFDAFGARWRNDITQQLRMEDVRVFDADYGALPELAAYDGARDCVITWNATAAGVMVPDSDWIPDNREGLVFADCTSAAFAMPLPFDKLDVLTFSWQKTLGGEAAHGIIALSPRAMARLKTHKPAWPVPHTLRLGGGAPEDFFDGKTVNTPSMLCVEDAIDALTWARDIGGGAELHARVMRNFSVLREFVEASRDFAFAAQDAKTISPISVTLRLVDDDNAAEVIRELTSRLAKEGIAFDINAYATAPPGLRIWCGPTVESDDLKALMPWLAATLAEIRE